MPRGSHPLASSPVISQRSSGAATATLAAVAVASAVAMRVAFPDRSDYAGHFLAGAGGTALLIALVLPLRRGGDWRVAAVGALGVLGGVGTEATVFRLAEFDAVDLANQSLGAVVACAAYLGTTGLRAALGAAAAGVALTVAGFFYAFA